MKLKWFARERVTEEPPAEQRQWPPEEWEPSIIGTRSRHAIGGNDDYAPPPKDGYRSFLECATWIRNGQQLTSIRPPSSSPKAQVWLNLDALIPTEDAGGDVLLFEEQEPVVQAVLEHIVRSTYERINIVNRMLTEYRDEACGTSTEPQTVEAPVDLGFDGPFSPYRWKSGSWITTADALGVDGPDQDVATPEGTVFIRDGVVIGGTGAAGRFESSVTGSQHIGRYLAVKVGYLIPPRDWNREPLPAELVSRIEGVLTQHVVDGHAARQQLVQERWSSQRRVPTSELVIEKDGLFTRIATIAEGLGVALGDCETDAMATLARRPYGVDELAFVESELVRRGYRLNPRDDAFNLVRAVARDQGVSLGEQAVKDLARQLGFGASREAVVSLLRSSGLLDA